MIKVKAILSVLLVTFLLGIGMAHAETPNSQISWGQGSNAAVEATGIGMPPQNATSVAQAHALARRAAIVDAYRNLLEATQSIQVNADTTVQNLMVQDDTIKTKVSGMIQGARIIREMPQPDGSYQVTMSLPLYGGTNSVAGIALPIVEANVVPQNIPAPTTTPAASQSMPQYTGLIVDARGLDLQPTFSPALYDENGRAIYGTSFIDANFAINSGMVDYAPTQELVDQAISGHSRAGALPLVVKAVGIKGNNCNLIISKADAEIILYANQGNGFLQKCAVVFLK